MLGRLDHLTWISENRNTSEAVRALATLEDFEPVRAGLDYLETPRAGGPVVVDCDSADRALVDRISRFQRQNPQRSLFLRIKEPLAPEHAEVLGNVCVLDGFEGPELLKTRLRGALSPASSSRPTVAPCRDGLIGDSLPMQRVVEIINLIGPRRCTVLITGETGTGKEVVARSIHRASTRSSAPFVAINCSALPPALLESELFGYARGAFTGAVQTRAGHFEQANGGTLFLDEIGELPLELQAKLLRALQEREIRKLGSSETVRVDTRVIAATNCDLRARVREGTFREDLYYRLNVVPIELPALRARNSDIPLLAEHFLSLVCREERIPLKRLTPDAWRKLLNYSWPGNVRQLENVITSAVVLSGDREYLDGDEFSLDYEMVETDAPATTGIVIPDHGIDFTETINALERDLLQQALRRTRGNKTQAAEMLRLKRTTLAAKLRVLECEPSYD